MSDFCRHVLKPPCPLGCTRTTLQAAEQIEILQAERDAIRKELEDCKRDLGEALSEWDDASNYKGEYLKEKHEDAECIANLRKKWGLT